MPGRAASPSAALSGEPRRALAPPRRRALASAAGSGASARSSAAGLASGAGSAAGASGAFSAAGSDGFLGGLAAPRAVAPPAGAASRGPEPMRCSRPAAGGTVAGEPWVDLEDPEAQHAVGDPKVVVELVEQPPLGLEAEEAVVGLGALADLVGELAHAPRGVVLELAAGLDALFAPPR